MERIVIVGCSGSGKSTLARKLGEKLNLPVTHLDALFWQPGWQEHPDNDAFQSRIREIAERERWIIDGGYTTGSAEARFSCADMVILLDFPVWLCLWRAVWRVVEFWGKTRGDMGPDCPEKVDLEFLNYIWTSRRLQLPELEENIAAYFKGHPVRLKRPRDVNGLLENLPDQRTEQT